MKIQEIVITRDKKVILKTNKDGKESFFIKNKGEKERRLVKVIK